MLHITPQLTAFPRSVSTKIVIRSAVIWLGLLVVVGRSWAYPPAVGIIGSSKNCLTCHVNNGEWREGADLIIDLRDQSTGRSLKQPDGSFLLRVKRHQAATVQTIIGYQTADPGLIPKRNGWLYVDPDAVGSASLSKFLAGWEANLSASCRLVGDKMPEFEKAYVTSLPMTIRPADAARSGEVALQVMITKGESVKGKPNQGMIGSYFERRFRLEVED